MPGRQPPQRLYYPRCVVVLEILLEDFQDGSDDSVHQIAVVPTDVDIDRNGFLEADTARCTLALRDLPVEPRALRQVRVRIYLGDTGEPADRIPTTRDNAAFVGWVDDVKQSMDAAAEIVGLECRDYTAAFLDHKWGPKAVNLTERLSRVVFHVLQEVPGAEEMPFSIASGKANTVVSTVTGRKKYAPKSSKDSAWQVLTDICALMGLTPVVELDTLHVRAASEFSQTSSDFIYGDNITKFMMSRNLQGARKKQVQVRSWNPETRTTLTATFPEEPIVLTKKISTSGKVTQTAAPLISYPVTGTYTQTDLLDIAEQIYLRAAREQIEGELETREMSSLSRNNLVQVGNGDTVRVTVRRGTTERIAGLSDADARRELGTGPNRLKPEIIEVLLAGRRRSETLVTTFYVQSAKHKWTPIDGYVLSLRFINFIGASL